MNKERELLERWLDDTIFEPEELDSLMEETRELLAQPEQEIACWGSFDLGGKCVGTHETRRLAAQIQGGNEVFPLFLKQERREPLSIEDIYKALETFCGATSKEPLPMTLEEFLEKDFYKDFIALVREVERLHGVER